MRITLLTGSILILCSFILTWSILYSANNQFEVLAGTDFSVTVPVEEFTPIPPRDLEITEITLNPLVTARRQLNFTSALLLAAVCMVGTGLVYVVAGKSLRPIHDLNDAVSNISENNLNARISTEDRKDEVGELSQSFNVMLNRLEASFLRQKRFSANVAHELKTPLATINAGIQVLKLEEEPTLSDCLETLAITERNIKRLIPIVDDLMRLCDEEEEFEMESIKLQDMFHAIAEELNPLLKAKKIELTIDCKETLIYGNSRLVYGAFFNLIENGIKYNKIGGKINIVSKKENDFRTIQIIDTGDGISKEELPYIFDPFYCVNKSRSRKTGGSGLGLSIVRTIIDKHGWTIDVESELGVGTVFTIKIK